MVELKSFENGFAYLEVTNASSSAKIALQGAHVFEYKRGEKEEILWLSDTSVFELGTGIRGGVPVCWPAFGMNNPDLPQHGFSRTALFEFVNFNEISKDETEVRLRLRDTKESLKLWNYKFELELIVRVSDTLSLKLKTTNRDTKEFKLTQALHSYFNVSDISNAVVKGLKGKPRLDALKDIIFIQENDIKFDQEFDSVFQEVNNEIVLEDKVHPKGIRSTANGKAREGALGYKERRVSIINEGSSSVVVWNPWIEKGSRMSGMRADAYREFVCIESANAYEDFRILKPNETHSLKATLR